MQSIAAVTSMAMVAFQFSSVCSQIHRSVPGRGGVVAHDVHLPELADRAGDHGFDVVLVRHVGPHRDGTRTGVRRRLLHELLATGGKQHPGPFPHEHRGHHGAEPGARPGDDGDLAVESPAAHARHASHSIMVRSGPANNGRTAPERQRSSTSGASAFVAERGSSSR